VNDREEVVKPIAEWEESRGDWVADRIDDAMMRGEL
jgi:hypothetical protein